MSGREPAFPIEGQIKKKGTDKGGIKMECLNFIGETKSCGVCGKCEEKNYEFICYACKTISPCVLTFRSANSPTDMPRFCPYKNEITQWEKVKKEKTCENCTLPAAERT
jgi:hypothetical protein